MEGTWKRLKRKRKIFDRKRKKLKDVKTVKEKRQKLHFLNVNLEQEILKK